MRQPLQVIPHMNLVRFVIAGERVHHETSRAARVRARCSLPARAARGFRRRGRFGYAAHAASNRDSVLHR
jgi:hypothetical protein